jgi:cyclophilin family peptidyl-prolyl cis-trans isomerase/HEAT repeat protein
MRKTFAITILIAIVSILIACGGEKETKLPADKLIRIAIWEDKREPDTLLYTYLGDKDPNVRTRACYALGMIAPPGASAYIVDLLNDSVPKVRMMAVFSLRLLGDSLYTKDLIPLLNDPDTAISHQAVFALGAMGGDTAVIALMQMGQDTIPYRRAWAADGLWRTKADTTVALLKDMVTDSSLEVEEAAVYALRRLADKSAASNLRFRLRDTIPEIRMYAAQGLAAMKDTASLMSLSNALSREREWLVKVSLLRAIGEVGDKRVVKTLMNLLNPDENPDVLALDMEVIAKLKIDALYPKILPFLESDEPYIKGAAIVSLSRLNGEKFLPMIANKIDGYDWYLKMMSAEALQYTKNTQSANILEKLFRDGDPRVRTRALYSLAELDFVDMDKYLWEGLDDPDPTVELTAIDIITLGKMEQYTQKILGLYESQKGNENPEIRYGIVYGLGGWIEDSQVVDPNIEELLYEAVQDSRRIVRQVAIDILAQTGENESQYLGYFITDIDAKTYGEYYGRYTKNPVAEINTNRGQIKVELLYNMAPKTVVNFIRLAESGFYEGVIFHRVVPNFVIQAGQPHGEGFEGPGYTIRSEYNWHPYTRGTMGMANSGKDTGGSQWFICQSAQPQLDARYTAFGQVIWGLSVVDRILVGDTIKTIDIVYGED